MTPTVRKIAAALLLLLGAQLWLVVGRGQWGNLPGIFVWVVLLLLAVVPPINKRLVALLDRLARPSPGTRLIVTLVVALLAGGYLYFTAVRQHRDFFPKILDEHSYAIQARMLAAGRLWMPPHPAADSFDSPYVLVQPVYASMYFPGTALTLVPGVWLGMPWWVAPLLACAAGAGVLYRVVGELVDGVAGLLAALMLVSLSTYRELSLRLYSQVPLLLLALCLTWAWLAWRRDRRAWRAAVIGLLAGWMLVVRPIDALVFLAPLAVAMALDLRRFDRRTLAAVAAGVVPFLLLQLIANRGVTGSWLTTPHAFYAQRDYPGVTFGFHEPRPPSTLATQVPQKRALYAEAIPAIERHRPATALHDLFDGRLRTTVSVTLPSELLLILVPLGAAALLTPQRLRDRAWLVAAPLPLFMLAYAFYLFYFAHYVLVAAPAMIFLVVLAVRELPQLWPRARSAVAVFAAGSVMVVSVWALPELDRTLRDDVGAADLRAINELLAGLPHRPAIVLFRPAPDGGEPHREPVYNLDSANIDDADVVRAHDLPGEANEQLLAHYASHQPQRHVYRVDRAPDGGRPTLTYLGPVTAVSQAGDEPL